MCLREKFNHLGIEKIWRNKISGKFHKSKKLRESAQNFLLLKFVSSLSVGKGCHLCGGECGRL
jgi:hypothetical protein